MPKKETYTVKQVNDALKQGDGYVSQAAQILGCTSATVYNYAKRHKTVQTTWDDIKEKRHDFVENSIMRGIKNDNATLMIFYAKTQMKERGYIEKQQIEHSGNVNVTELSDDELQAIIKG